jgi:hypothetical protein
MKEQLGISTGGDGTENPTVEVDVIERPLTEEMEVGYTPERVVSISPVVIDRRVHLVALTSKGRMFSGRFDGASVPWAALNGPVDEGAA